MDRSDNPDSRATRELAYEEWFLREVDKGIEAANHGKFAEHCAVRNLIDERYPG